MIPLGFMVIFKMATYDGHWDSWTEFQTRSAQRKAEDKAEHEKQEKERIQKLVNQDNQIASFNEVYYGVVDHLGKRSEKLYPNLNFIRDAFDPSKTGLPFTWNEYLAKGWRVVRFHKYKKYRVFDAKCEPHSEHLYNTHKEAEESCNIYPFNWTDFACKGYSISELHFEDNLNIPNEISKI